MYSYKELLCCILSYNRGTRCWNGLSAPGRVILRAWWREKRVTNDRVKAIAQGLRRLLNSRSFPTSSPERFLACLKTFEPSWGAPPSASEERLAHVCTTETLL